MDGPDDTGISDDGNTGNTGATGSDDGYDASTDADVNMDGPEDTGEAGTAGGEAANTDGGYSTDGAGTYDTNIGTFSQDSDDPYGGYTFDGRSLEDAFPNTREDPDKDVNPDRERSFVSDRNEAQWDAADTLGEYVEYGLDRVADNPFSIAAGILTMGASLPVSLGVNAAAAYADAKSQGYSDKAAMDIATLDVGKSAAGKAGGQVGGQVGYSVAGLPGAAVGQMIGSYAAKGAVEDGFNTGVGAMSDAPTLADSGDHFGSGFGDSDSDSAVPLNQSPLAQADTEDVYATAGRFSSRSRSRMGRGRKGYNRSPASVGLLRSVRG